MDDLRSMIANPIGLGTANLQPYFEGPRSRRLLHTALDVGISYFDTSPRYGLSEKFLGDYLPKNEQLIIATKVGLDPLHASAVSIIRDQLKRKLKKVVHRSKPKPQYVSAEPVNPFLIYSFDSFQKSIERSLKLLRIEALDVLHIHEPENIINLEELLDWMDTKRRAGLVKYRGLAVHRVGSNLLDASLDADIIWQFPWAYSHLYAKKCNMPIIFRASRALHRNDRTIDNLRALIQETPRAIVLTQTNTPNHLKWVREL